MAPDARFGARRVLRPGGKMAGERVCSQIIAITAEGRTGPIPPLLLSFGPLHLSILWVAWTNLSPHVHSTCLFFGSRGPTSPIQVCVPDMSVLSTRVWVQQAACKGCKGKRGPPGPSCSHPENPSSSRQKRVFLRSDPIGKNGGLSLNTLNKTVSTRRGPKPCVKGVKGNEALWSPPAPTQKNPPVRDKREFF